MQLPKTLTESNRQLQQTRRELELTQQILRHLVDGLSRVENFAELREPFVTGKITLHECALNMLDELNRYEAAPLPLGDVQIFIPDGRDRLRESLDQQTSRNDSDAGFIIPPGSGNYG